MQMPTDRAALKLSDSILYTAVRCGSLLPSDTGVPGLSHYLKMRDMGLARRMNDVEGAMTSGESAGLEVAAWLDEALPLDRPSACEAGSQIRQTAFYTVLMTLRCQPSMPNRNPTSAVVPNGTHL